MKRILPYLLFGLAWIPQAHADLRIGPGMTASDFAAHFEVLCWSFNFLSPKPFHKMEVRVNYYEKNKSGSFEGRTLAGYTQIPVKAETRTVIKILVDSKKSTIVHPEGSVSGDGFSFDKDDATLFSAQPVEPAKDGKYVIWQRAARGTKLVHGVVGDSVNAYLELELKPTF